jgi:hypothetical protein
MEKVLSFYQTARCQFPECSNLHGHLCEYVNSNTIRIICVMFDEAINWLDHNLNILFVSSYAVQESYTVLGGTKSPSSITWSERGT